MYEKQKRDWAKHLDFIVLDILCLQIAFIIAYMIRHGLQSPYLDPGYLSLGIVYLLIDFFCAIVFEAFKNVLRRGIYKEFMAVAKHVFLVEGLTLFFLFSTKQGSNYSRIFTYLLIGLYTILTLLVRQWWKRMLRLSKRREKRSLLIIASADRLEECITNLQETGYSVFTSVKAVVKDADMKGQEIKGVPVAANYSELFDYICGEWVDEVFIDVNQEEGYPLELVNKLNLMGVVIHVSIAKRGDIMEHKQQVERFGNYTVLTTSLNYASSTQLMLKRGMDIAGGFLGCLITLLLILLVGPAIYICSPGPIFFSQERVGRNGRKFKIYKFRTMYMDAEERKKELMQYNKLGDNKMFKLDYDPRIIGNKKLPDGTIKKGIGSFLRESSLDEFPQMFNILKGDMSLVGTRPPTVDEWESYDLHHHARLAFRPGLTGMWQVSGRSSITDFEEVVKLDTKYITEWNFGLDIKILLKTILTVVKKNGAV